MFLFELLRTFIVVFFLAILAFMVIGWLGSSNLWLWLFMPMLAFVLYANFIEPLLRWLINNK